MRPTVRPSHTGVIQRLVERPYGFGFFQAVRLLELFFKKQPRSQSELPPRPIQFRASVSTSFPASEIEQLVVMDENGAPLPTNGHVAQDSLESISAIHLTPGFFGLLGHQGALPTHYTEQLVEREVLARDKAARHFVELFSNRATALFYAAWKKYRLALHYETDRTDVFLPNVMSLAGFNTNQFSHAQQRGQYALPDEVYAHYAGLLRHRPVSAQVIQQILSDYFRINVRVEQFVGHWYVVPETQRTQLGMTSALLGKNTLCGARVWQRNLRVRLWLGPLNANDYQQFLPQGPARQTLGQWLRMFTGDCLEYEVRPILHKDAVQGMQLGPHSRARLGWDTFLCTRHSPNDRTDVSYLANITADRKAA